MFIWSPDEVSDLLPSPIAPGMRKSGASFGYQIKNQILLSFRPYGIFHLKAFPAQIVRINDFAPTLSPKI